MEIYVCLSTLKKTWVHECLSRKPGVLYLRVTVCEGEAHGVKFTQS